MRRRSICIVTNYEQTELVQMTLTIKSTLPTKANNVVIRDLALIPYA